MITVATNGYRQVSTAHATGPRAHEHAAGAAGAFPFAPAPAPSASRGAGAGGSASRSIAAGRRAAARTGERPGPVVEPPAPGTPEPEVLEGRSPRRPRNF